MMKTGSPKSGALTTMAKDPNSYKSVKRKAQVSWQATPDSAGLYAAQVGADRWTVRVNDFPDKHLYTLLVNGDETESFDDWPESWTRPSKTRMEPGQDLETIRLSELIRTLRILAADSPERQAKIELLARAYAGTDASRVSELVKSLLDSDPPRLPLQPHPRQ